MGSLACVYCPPAAEALVAIGVDVSPSLAASDPLNECKNRLRAGPQSPKTNPSMQKAANLLAKISMLI
eukprot:CAMPEP_0183730062 /NCGR_PEP_ID=MMETSP0737-20130205/31908_1 /TAXON_ID=385413 /ORGANISM="Thalassiosira miniscula, Strain CCMP1093" /LENGTH=67 /DNA_ID=CAMNT_0025962443 /DNA_START=9 /DNA_END=209 /DNA_ORIENTATION=+